MTTVEDVFLEHFGKKGMKWGQRHAAKKEAKADAKWQHNIYSVHGAVAVHNHVADKMNNGVLDKLNSNPKYKGKSLIDMHTGEPIGSLGRQYLHDYNQLAAHHTAQAIREIHGVSPSGKYQAKLDTSDKNNWKVKVSPTKMSHGIEGMDEMMPSPKTPVTEPELLFEVNHEDSGHITSHKKVKDSVSQSEDLINNILSHHGVKGMRWGARKGTTVSRDAQKATTTQKKAAKNKTGVKALTNQELGHFNKRLELEKKYHELTAKKSTVDKGHAHVKKALAIGATANAAYAFSKTPTGKVLKDQILGKGKHFSK